MCTFTIEDRNNSLAKSRYIIYVGILYNAIIIYTIFGWLVRGKLREVGLNPLALCHLRPEDVLLVQEEDD